MKKQIMKRAWELKRQAIASGMTDVLFSECLREAWAETKGEKKMVTIKLENIGSSKSWVAEITGKDKKFGLKREFLSGVRDYSRANSVNTRGVYTEFELEEGKIYEVSERVSWQRTDRFFCIVNNGILTRLTSKEVMEAQNETE